MPTLSAQTSFSNRVLCVKLDKSLHFICQPNKFEKMTHWLPPSWRLRRTREAHSDKPRETEPPDYELIPGKRAGKHVVPCPDADDVWMEVFFKDFSNAKGPAELADGRGPVISLIVRDFEVIRFDCLGETGHYHIVFARPEATTTNRIWFYESSVEAQVKRALFEIETNIEYYLQRNPKRQVRSAVLSPDQTSAMCRQAQEIAMAMTATV